MKHYPEHYERRMSGRNRAPSARQPRRSQPAMQTPHETALTTAVAGAGVDGGGREAAEDECDGSAANDSGGARPLRRPDRQAGLGVSATNQSDRIGNIRKRPPIRLTASGISANDHQSE
eukprot:1195029-Prorocentrum_minimum.AAC.1